MERTHSTLRFALTAAVLGSAVALTGCGGSSSSSRSGGSGGIGGPVIGSVTTQNFTVTGTAEFEKPVIDKASASLSPGTTVEPIAFAEVEVTDGAVVVASTSTDANGSFSMNLDASLGATPLMVRVLSKSAVYPVEVTNHNNALYAMSSQAFLGAQDFQIVGSASVADGRSSAPFNILVQIQRGMAFVQGVDPTATFPALQAQWTANIGTQTVTRFRITDMVLEFLDDPASDTDCFDDSIILHELGHYMQTVFSSDSTPGGSHFGCSGPFPQDLDYRLAFAEGWANAFGQTVLGDPIYVDTFTGGGFTNDLEFPCTQVTGPGAEHSVDGGLWDLIDGAGAGSPGNDDGDTLAVGFGPVWQAFKALRGTPHVHLAHLADALLTAGAVTGNEWNANLAGLDLLLPITDQAFSVQSNTVFKDSLDASLAQSSLRAANGFYLLTLSQPPDLTAILNVADPFASELDLVVRLPDNEGFISDSSGGSDAISIPNAAPGTYLLRVFARDTVIGSTNAGFVFEAQVQ